MAIAFSNLGASANPDIANAADLASYPNTSWAPPASGLVVACVYNRRTAAAADLPTISGNSLTWTQVATFQPSGDGGSSRMTIFGADASGSTTEATTVDFGGSTQLGCYTSFFGATGVDLSGGVVPAFIQTPTGQGGSGTATVTLSAAADANNRPFAFVWHFANEPHTPRASWTEADDMAGAGPNIGVMTQYREDAFETTATATWTTTSVSWGIIAVELKAALDVPPTRIPRMTRDRRAGN
jgi:hypothetical protein